VSIAFLHECTSSIPSENDEKSHIANHLINAAKKQLPTHTSPSPTYWMKKRMKKHKRARCV